MHRALILAALAAAPIIAPTAPAVASVPATGTLSGSGDVVSIETSDDLKLVATYYAPKKGRAPAVLLLHDAGARRNQLADIAARLNKTGFGVLTLDLRGHGDSKTSRLDWDDLDEQGRASLWQLAPRDVVAAADWLLSQKNVHSTNLSLVGYRAGCALVARHAERDENVIGIALLSPRPKELGLDVEGDIHKVNGLPTCVIDQRNDEIERMVTNANSLTPSPWIEWVPVASKEPTVLDDPKTPSRVSKWLSDVAMPKRGRG